MRRVKTAVLISGNGSNLQALLDATKRADYPAEIALVISNKPDAYGLTRATEAGIPTLTIRHTDYPDRDRFDAAMTAALEAANIELVCLAGFMRILSDGFVHHWQGRLINIHPSLLPAYKGMHTHQRALDAHETHHGATVHWVIPELDAGEIIAQQSLEIAPDDTAETLQHRVHALEHALYPEALKKVAADMQKNSGARRAFSLVELSIVLVILGLLVGGILAGQSLIRASELRALIAEHDRYKTAVHAFRDKYFALPGDMTNATSFWGKDTTSISSCVSNTGTAATPGTCNGNGDGFIGSGAIGDAEGVRAWQQLAIAGLIEGTYNGIDGQNLAIGTNVPMSKVALAGWNFSYRNSANAIWGQSATFLQTGAFYSVVPNGLYNPILRPEEAWNIDTKMDDGSPERGNALQGNGNCVSPATSPSLLPAGTVYALTNTSLTCYFYFKL